ncbi:uncharacterized protein LOC128745294 [Sabethes cyaneus]|uniref:uncharacterized protein LOC128745294 n=1 Tax=Sabethes cyaneus TaxID=53552 RepID=UPI00237EB8DA|nr:uncharacterized protein LOC128745294 [Sabethes cyaneus]
MSKQYDIFDNLNRYLDNTEDCDIPDDVGDTDIEGSFIEPQPEPAAVKNKRVTKRTALLESIKPSSPPKKTSSNKRKAIADSASDDTSLLPLKSSDKSPESIPYVPQEPMSMLSSTSLDESPESVASAPVRQVEAHTINLDNDLDQQMVEVQRQYDLIFNKSNCYNASEKRYFADLKKKYQNIMRQCKGPRRRSQRNQGSGFLDDLLTFKALLYDICVNRNLMAPKPSSSAAVVNEPARRRRQAPPEVINLVDSPALILPGVINLDSDEEIASESIANHSFDSDNYEVSIKIKWQGSIKRHTLRKYQKFADLIAQLAKEFNADSSCVILDVNERIIDPNDTPDSIGYKITQFITGRIVEKTVASMFAGKQSKSTRVNANSSASANTISLKVQSDRWKIPLQITVGVEQKMKIVIIKCAEELKCSTGDFKLNFDGEPVEIDATPTDLGLEDGEILDLRFVKT